MRQQIGHYRIVRQIGRGGMGVVFEAVDERLQRPVAIKVLLPESDAHLHERLLREARTAAAVSHPHICQLFEIGEHDGEPFLAMELLEGQSLADRLEAGPLAPEEAIATAIAVLSALEALHQRAIVHRDLKPSNVFLSSHGVKLLDFGLARPVDANLLETSVLTQPGTLVGTPRYMSPEQARGVNVDARTDLFSSGVLLFEMLTGRAAFNGPSAIETLNAILHEQPPALTGGLAIVDADRVIQRALMKAPSERYQSAEDMGRDLKACLARSDLSNAVSVRVATRLMVLPFRMLRPDPIIDFLAFSLPDAITVSLSGLESLIVRSSLVAARYVRDPLDLAALAHEAAIDAVVTGSLLQAGGLVRVNVQLIEVPSGTVLWSHAAQVPVDDMFQVQDAVCSAVVEALALPLSSREQRMLRRDVPAASEAYAHYLRANRLSANSSQWGAAVESYQRAVEADPAYAPAWARYGRCLRIMSKYAQSADAAVWQRQAEEAIQRAFRINPDLSLAHHLYTHFEVDAGRASEAMLRLLGRVRHCATDPELFAGLVHACRYVGLLDASMAAHDRAIRLDPSIRTTIAHTRFLAGDFERAIALDVDDPPYLSALALIALERQAEALELCVRALDRPPANEHLLFLIKSIQASLGGERAAALDSIARLQNAFPAFSDPEGLFYWAQVSVGLGDSAGALSMLSRAVDGGLHSVTAYERNPVLGRIRPASALADLIERARVRQDEAARAFVEADGPRLLGVSA